MLCVYAFLFLILNGVGLGSLQDKLNDFGLKVFTQLAQSSEDKNVALSPYGVSTVLAMAQLGAAGSTRRALTTAMGFSLQGEWYMDLKENETNNFLILFALCNKSWQYRAVTRIWTNIFVDFARLEHGRKVYWCIVGVTTQSSHLYCRARDVSAAASPPSGHVQWGGCGNSQWGYGRAEDESGEGFPPGPGQGLPDPPSPGGLHQSRPGSCHHQLMGLGPHCRYPHRHLLPPGFSKELLFQHHQLLLCFYLLNPLWPLLCLLQQLPSLSSWYVDLWQMRPAWSCSTLSIFRPSGKFPLTPKWHRRGCSTVPTGALCPCTWWDSPTASTMVTFNALTQCIYFVIYQVICELLTKKHTSP